MEEVLELAISRLGTVYGKSIAILLGVNDSSYKKVSERRLEAYEVFCAAEYSRLPPGYPNPGIRLETFRTHTEREMLSALVTQLIKIDNED